jgi:hypothetical protein
MVDVRTHGQAGSPAKVTCAVTQVMSSDTEGYSPSVRDAPKALSFSIRHGIPHFAIRGSN